IDLDLVAIAFAQARTRSSYGTYATLTPMRFKAGSLYTTRQSQTYTVQRLYGPDGRERLYILTFYMPRFMDVDLLEKLTTIIHELWHISPRFDGDIRRFSGRCYAHSHSQEKYDAAMQHLARRWLDTKPPEALYGFLKYRFDELQNRCGRIYGAKVRHPKLIPCAHRSVIASDAYGL
ncbi:MAG: hypothetical protein O7D32_10230, partial [bacterium]|nr:hypothetical protein [bacterium]